MKRNYYIFHNTIIKRNGNTILFQILNEKEINDDFNKEEIILNENEEDRIENKKYIPINDIDSLYSFGEVNFNSKLINFLNKFNIPVHIFNYYGNYSGSYCPKESLISGKLLINQVKHYLDKEKRLYLAKEFLEASSYFILDNLKNFNDIKFVYNKINIINKLKEKIKLQNDINELMAIEGNIRKNYYNCWNHFIKQNINFQKRTRKPPNNMINTLISFGNMLCYTTCISEIYKTQLNPTISYLHEPGDRRFSLSLDIAEIFKPLLIDPLIFNFLNNKILTEDDFNKKLNYCLFKEKPKQRFVEGWENKLKTTFYHRKLKRDVSFKRLIRLECYKLTKHLLDIEQYKHYKF